VELRSERVLKWAGLVLGAGVCLEVLISMVVAEEPQTLWGSSSPVALALGFLAVVTFVAAFAWVMGPGLGGKRPRTLFAALVVMTLIGTIVQSNLAYVVAMTLPCVLRRRVAVLWLVLWNAVTVPFLVFYVRAYPEESGVAATTGVVLLVLAIAPHVIWQLWAFAVGLVVATEGRSRAELARFNRRLIEAQAQLADRARLEERVDIARDLHDTIGHHLAALNVQLELARHLSEGTAREAVMKAHDTGRRLLGDVRAAVSVWRADAAMDLPVALARLAETIQEPAIQVTVQPGLRVDQPAHAKALLRCAQEAVTNAVRHGNAHHVWLELTRADGWMRLSARDDGCGQRTIAPGNGLRGLQERAVALGGELRVDAHPGAGFVVAMRLPEAS
jgi:signal transduction histidine kinase